MRQITLPEKISVTELKDHHYQVILEPFYPGFGITVGNSLRRVLLSSLEGAAVTSFKIEGAKHEFDSVDFVKEDLVEIMLNLKKLRLKCYSTEPVKLSLEVKGEKEVTAADIKKNSAVEIINTDLVIATLTDKHAKLSMEITVEKGIGYMAVDQRGEKEKLEIGNMAIDASFSPVLNVGYNIENVRVGEMTNYERLTMDVLTDGTIDAQSAISKAAQLLRDQFNFFVQETVVAEPEVEAEVKEAKKKSGKKDKEKDTEEKKTKKTK